MPIVDGYATLEQVQGWVGDSGTASEDYLEHLITGVSRSIDEYCDRGGRRFFGRRGAPDEPIAREFDADRAPVEVGDLVSVVTIEGDDGTGTWDIDLTGGARLLPTNSDSQVPARPFTHVDVGPTVRRVRISGVWGWPEVPAQVHQACLMQTARLWERRKSPVGVAAGFGDFPGLRVYGDWDRDALALLEPFRIRHWGIA